MPFDEKIELISIIVSLDGKDHDLIIKVLLNDFISYVISSMFCELLT